MAHILVIDDEEQIRSVIRAVLEPAGHNVFEARDGQAALDILETYPTSFAIIILDTHLPGMNGFEFLSILQKQPFHPLVLILTAHADEIPQALAGMVNGHLLKPFRQQELKDRVNSLLGQDTLTRL